MRPAATTFSPNVRIATLQQHSNEGHFSAHGMPDRPCVMSVRAVLRGDDTRTRPQSPSRCPLGIGVLFRQSGPALSSGPVSSVEVAAGPSAGRVLGNAPGPTTADRF